MELRAVSKQFVSRVGTPITAVNALSLKIRRGEIFCLVGPDGAGKTTTIRMMCGVLAPTDGTISVLGFDTRKNRSEVKKHIGYLSQRFSLYGDLTVDENIDFFAEIHRIKEFKARKEELLAFTRLTSFRSRLAAQLSGGMKQKLALACTLVHTPDIIFLDEPTTGVDPVSRRDFWKILSSLLKSGITIVVSTPYLDEAERSSRVAMINEGRLLTCDTPEAIRAAFPFAVLEIVCDQPREAVRALEQTYEPSSLQLFGDRVHLLASSRSGGEKTVAGQLKRAHIRPSSIRWAAPSLEDIFVSRMRT
ncbi:MAG: ABC transporter ATP-binding protein [Ignavibacteriales bacterium]|nr:ABC transporter ATP-binding protein [Ignavibacteriales bacterium]